MSRNGLFGIQKGLLHRPSARAERQLTIKDEPTVSSTARAIGQKYAPYEGSIHTVKTAYSILAYPHCKYKGWKEQIESELERDRQPYGRDQVTLTDQEFQILNQITTARKISLDPEKRVYSHSEVPIPHWINPFGRRHLTTQQIREYLTQTDNGKSK